MTVTSEPVRDVFDAGGRGLQHHGLRRANERAVLTLIGFNSGVSNADIARLSGLAPQTVSAILADIERAGLISRGPVLRGRRGQPATPIFLRAEGAFSIGVEIGWRHVEVLLLDLAANVRSTRRWHFDYPDAGTLVGEIAVVVAELVATLPEAQRLLVRGIGVALPTNIAANLHLVAAPEEQYALWTNLDLAGDLGRRTGFEVSLFNDGNAACWAELIAFERPRPGNFIYFLIARYVAAGIVGEGTLWEGPSGNSANLGSMLVRHGDGPLQPAHFIASVSALEQRLADAGFLVIPSQFETWDWDAFEPVVAQWIADSGNILARVVFNTSTVIETGLVVIDTILPADIATRLVAKVEEELKRLPVPSYSPPQVLLGHLGALAPAMGAAELTLYRRYFSRTLADLVG
ncbi:Sugar kinase of the NBD/HSP70 family, may contain an N-terminal HTH domain [Devosia sp. YR412]|uniref:ROK family transcriptional regulator n=1 Tax=Devosia sp. YR412 TaxID=1881030 RepID=UPI0008B583FE|nr:ROK family transcriptional regulator [Devosia sp. YR412]SEP65603.1 Sugar kinase of the NBD/HSP70 family, may contain an N-terminal HTH domain [Devosia sp. YR412]